MRPAWFVGPIAIVALLGVIVLMHKLGYRKGVGNSPGFNTVGTSLISLLYGSVLVVAIAARPRTWRHTFFANRIIRTLGKYSYALYLLHLPVMVLVSEHLFNPIQLSMGPNHLPGYVVFCAITWTLSLLVAILSWHLLEKHFLKLKDFFPMEKKADTATAWEGKDIAHAERSSKTS